MKTIANHSDNLVSEMKDGLIAAGCGKLKSLQNLQAIYQVEAYEKPIIVVSGGGCGYEPLYAGWCGKGMADIMMLGNIDAAPSAYMTYKSVLQTGQHTGVIFVYGNYAGDFLNYDMAAELLQQENILAKSIIVKDAIYSDTSPDKRSGTAGIMWAIKMASAAVSFSHSFEETVRLAQDATNNLFTASFTVEANNVSTKSLCFGKGLSGELCQYTSPMLSADKIAEKLYADLAKEADLKKGDSICILINSYSVTSFMEMQILLRKINLLAENNGITLHHVDIGRYYCLDGQEGCSVTFLKLNKELTPLFDISANSSGYQKV